jgi:hypothetical protein
MPQTIQRKSLDPIFSMRGFDGEFDRGFCAFGRAFSLEFWRVGDDEGEGVMQNRNSVDTSRF